MPPSSALVSMNRPHVSKWCKLARQPMSIAGMNKRKRANPRATPQVDAAKRRRTGSGAGCCFPKVATRSNSCKNNRKPTCTKGSIFSTIGKARATPPASQARYVRPPRISRSPNSKK